MAIQQGDKIPSCTLKVMGENGPEDITTDSIFGGKKVVMFAVPGAPRRDHESVMVSAQ